MGNLQLYSNSWSMFDNPWIDMVSMPRDSFDDDTIHLFHKHANIYTINNNMLLIIADSNIITFNTNNSTYEKITTIPQYKYNSGPPTIKAINISKYYNKRNKYHFIIFQSNFDSELYDITTMYELVIHDTKNMIKYEWNDIKSLYMKNDKLIDLKCSKLLYYKHLLFLFYIQLWPTRMLAVFNLTNHQMIIYKIDSNKWFSISSMISINNYKFLSFNNIGPEIITYHPLLTQKHKHKISQKQIEFPIGFSLYFSSSNIKFSNYIIRFGSYSDCSSTGIISIYDYVNNKWHKSNIKSNGDGLIQSCTIQNKYIYCVGRNKSNNVDLNFTNSLLNHYKINVELLLFDLELLYWDDSANSRVLYVINHWLRMRQINTKEWNHNLSNKIMACLCDKD